MSDVLAIVGGGIAGLALTLSLHARGVRAQVYEAVPEVKELGVGITLLPHAMRELEKLGVMPEICAAGIENYESVFYTQHGQFIYSELRGKHAGYPLAEIGIHRGKLHRILYEKVIATCGADAVKTDHR
jgi:5-methylphenazine-1-carboxylate 1-monooxygenase